MPNRIAIIVVYENDMEGSDMDDKWVQGTVDRIQKELQENKLKDQKFAEGQQLKKNLGPGLWDELTEWLRAACKDINTKIGSDVAFFDIVSAEELHLGGKADSMHTRMRVKFSAQKSQLEYDSQSGDPSGKCEIVIDGTGKAGFAERGDHSATPAEDIGKRILNLALKVSTY